MMHRLKWTQRRTSPRWQLSDEERRRVDAFEGDWGAVEVAKIVARSPRVLSELASAMISGATEGAATNGSLVWVLDRERLRRTVPGAAGGANWGSEEWFSHHLLPRLGSEMHVLDLGCGAGRIARLVAPCVEHLTCADVSRVLLSEARENLAHLRNIELVRTDRYTLSPLEDSSFDLVYAQGVLSYLDPIVGLAVFDGVRRVLRPGGLSVVNLFTIDQPEGGDYALRVARTMARRGRRSGSTMTPYVTDQVRAMHSLVGLNVFEITQPDTIRLKSTIFVAVRDKSDGSILPQPAVLRVDG